MSILYQGQKAIGNGPEKSLGPVVFGIVLEVVLKNLIFFIFYFILN